MIYLPHSLTGIRLSTEELANHLEGYYQKLAYITLDDSRPVDTSQQNTQTQTLTDFDQHFQNS